MKKNLFILCLITFSFSYCQAQNNINRNQVNTNRQILEKAIIGHTYSLWVAPDLREDLTFGPDHRGTRSYYSKTTPNSEVHHFAWGTDQNCVSHDGSCWLILTQLAEQSSDGIMMSGGAQKYYGIINVDSIIAVTNDCDSYISKSARLSYWHYYVRSGSPNKLPAQRLDTMLLVSGGGSPQQGLFLYFSDNSKKTIVADGKIDSCTTTQGREALIVGSEPPLKIASKFMNKRFQVYFTPDSINTPDDEVVPGIKISKLVLIR